MSKDDCRSGITIKDATRHDAQRMRCCFDSKGPRGSAQPRMSFENRFAAEQRIPGVQVKGDIQFFESRPERQVSGVIEVNDAIGAADLRKPVHVDSLEA